jgi:hypothetical protein
VFVEALLRRVVDVAEEYPRGEVPERVLWQVPVHDYDEYIQAAKRLEGEGLVEKGSSDYATLRATEKGRKETEAFENSQTRQPLPVPAYPSNPLHVVLSTAPIGE